MNSDSAWTVTNPLSFMNLPLLTYIKEISPRPILLIHGENAHSRYFSETAYRGRGRTQRAGDHPGASHVDLYDRSDLIPFDRLPRFFGRNLAMS